MEAANTRAPKVVKEKKKMRGRSKVSGGIASTHDTVTNIHACRIIMTREGLHPLVFSGSGTARPTLAGFRTMHVPGGRMRDRTRPLLFVKFLGSFFPPTPFSLPFAAWPVGVSERAACLARRLSILARHVLDFWRLNTKYKQYRPAHKKPKL